MANDITAEAFLARLIEVTKATAFGAGEPEMETAGLFVSILGNHPEWIPRFMAEGFGLFIETGVGAELGNLNYRARNGTIITPEELFARKSAAQKGNARNG